MRFFIFFFLSFFLHVIIVFAFHLVHLENDEIKKNESMLSIDIHTIHLLPELKKAEPMVERKNSEIVPIKDVTQAEKKPLSKTKIRPKEVTKPTKMPITEEELTQEPPPIIATLPLEEGTLHVKMPVDSDDVLFQKIQEAIVKYKVYPKRAQRQGMEGEITVYFLWSQKGLSDLKMIKPSTHILLNEYAFELVNIASKEFPKVDKSIEIVIPIGFNLL